jgi:RHS repeat-associated protein
MDVTESTQRAAEAVDAVRGFERLSRADVEFAGGKGANLGELTAAGLPVPPGFVIGAPAYAAFCDGSGLRERIGERLAAVDVEDTAELERAAEEVRRMVESEPLPGRLEHEVAAAYERLAGEQRDAAVAVRSSATAEDTESASFAGMNETLLNVRGPDAVLDAVRRCWSSLFGARTVYYRAKRGFGQADMDIAVVVQRQIEATRAGAMWVADTQDNRIEKWAPAPSTTSYAYDQAGNLTAIERLEASEIPAIEEAYAYDGTGLRASQTVSGTTSHLTWNTSGGLPLLLDDGQASYVVGPGGLPVEQISEETPTFYHHDQLGSTRMLTNASGEPTATFTYSAYGQPAGSTGTQTTPLGYAGQLTNEESGLQYLRARVYDPATGQFLTRDPLLELTRQPYAYVFDNPANGVDPFGLRAEEAELPCIWPLCKPSPDAVKGLKEIGKGVKELAIKANQDQIPFPPDTPTAEEEYQEAIGMCPMKAGPPNVLRSEPEPPGYEPDTWEKGPRSGERSGESYWDPEGGEWVWHPRDRHHPDPHWDYNPWKQWNSPWQRVPPK